MARYTGAVCRLCRREGQKLFLKGERCYSDKCSVGIRGYAPGQHGQGRKKSSEYGLQLRAKQTARRFYGVQENQFHHYFEVAERKPGVTGDNLLKILESRLDNVVYRVGFASSRAEARQLVGPVILKLTVSALTSLHTFLKQAMKSLSVKKQRAAIKSRLSLKQTAQDLFLNGSVLTAKSLLLRF